VNVEDPITDPADRRELNALVVMFYLPVALGSLIYLRWSGGDYALWVRTLGEYPARDASLGLGVGLALALVSRLAVLLPSGRAMAETFGRAIGRPSVLTCLALALAAGTAEELLFRAVLQPELGIWLVTLLFAAAHFPFDRSLVLWPLMAFPTGLVFGALYDSTGAALAPMVAHTMVNALIARRPAIRR
jgi:uncharacterized protein